MSKAILPRKPAGKAKPAPAPRQRPNTAEERLKAMNRFKSYGAWLASLSPAERRNERRRLEAERRRGMPYPDATDADLTKLLYCVGTEWVRAFYPKARGASVMVSRPFGGGSDECVMLALDLVPDARPEPPKPAKVCGVTPPPPVTGADRTAAGVELADAVRRYGERLRLGWWENATVTFPPACHGEALPTHVVTVPFSDSDAAPLTSMVGGQPGGDDAQWYTSAEGVAAALRDWLVTSRALLERMREQAAQLGDEMQQRNEVVTRFVTDDEIRAVQNTLDRAEQAVAAITPPPKAGTLDLPNPARSAAQLRRQIAHCDALEAKAGRAQL